MLKFDELKTKYGKKAILAIVVFFLLVGTVFASKWMAGRDAQALADNLRNAFKLEHQSLYDNLAVLKDRTQQLEYQYGVQKGELVSLREKLRGGTSNVFKNPDKKVIASFFDNTVDSYIPSK